MKERPILFSAPMVRAILAGTKTQTRRPVKPQPYKNGRPEHWSICELSQFCPYGQPGDRLYVKEAIRLVPDQEPDDGTGRVLSIYETDGSLTVADAWPWKRAYLPSMFCPQGLSRITLEVTGIRVERLQDISESDAIAEGINCYPLRPDDGFPLCNGYTHEEDDGKCVLHESAVAAYIRLWEAINGPGSWDSNPWVWCVEFRRITP